jgi:hypothetical protein
MIISAFYVVSRYFSFRFTVRTILLEPPEKNLTKVMMYAYDTMYVEDEYG